MKSDSVQQSLSDIDWMYDSIEFIAEVVKDKGICQGGVA